MDRALGWLLVGLGALALAVSREPSMLTTAAAILAAGPLVNFFAGKRVPSWVVSTVLFGAALALPWPVAERMTLGAAVPVLQYVQSESIRLLVAASALMIIAGQSKLAAPYVVVSAAWVTLAIAWMATRQAALRARRGAGRRWRARDWLRVGTQLALTVGFAAGTAHGLPGVERWFIERAMNLDLASQSGFSTRTDLNGVESIRNSSKVALRIHDAGPFLMRGQAYGVYHMGVWTSARTGTFPIAPVAAGVALGQPIRVQSAVDGNTIAFAPLEWGAMTAPTPLFQDACRVTVMREAAGEWTFAPVRELRNHEPLGAADRAMYLQVPPEVESGLRPRLAPLLRPGTTDRQKIQGILYMLGETCQYSLDPGKPRGEEPIVRFLTRTRKGHCEYFASSLALLSRMAGVPSRYLTGYAAVERNTFGGYLMARDSDAHAWTEIWLAGEGWTVWDATPAGWQAADDADSKFSEMLRELGDYLTERWETAWEWVSRNVLRPLGAVGKRAVPLVVGALVLWLAGRFAPRLRGPLARLWAWLRARWRAPAPDATPPERRAAAGALGAFEELLGGLGLHRGLAVTPAELLGRLEAQGQPAEACAAARELVDAFCRFRYGGAAWDASRAAAALERLRAHLTPAVPAR